MSRDEWVMNLRNGDVASATLPGHKSPTVGKVVSVERIIGGVGDILGVELGGKEWVFHHGHLAGHPEILLQPVATGAGGSVGLPMSVTNIVERAEARDANEKARQQENSE